MIIIHVDYQIYLALWSAELFSPVYVYIHTYGCMHDVRHFDTNIDDSTLRLRRDEGETLFRNAARIANYLYTRKRVMTAAAPFPTVQRISH